MIDLNEHRKISNIKRTQDETWIDTMMNRLDKTGKITACIIWLLFFVYLLGVVWTNGF